MVAQPKPRKPTLLKIPATKLEQSQYGVSDWTISRFKGGVALSANPLGFGRHSHVAAPRRVWIKIAKFLRGE